MQNKIYLSANYHDKDIVKALGAKFDFEKKAWYIHSNMNPEPFSSWIDSDSLLELKKIQELHHSFSQRIDFEECYRYTSRPTFIINIWETDQKDSLSRSGYFWKSQQSLWRREIVMDFDSDQVDWCDDWTWKYYEREIKSKTILLNNDKYVDATLVSRFLWYFEHAQTVVPAADYKYGKISGRNSYELTVTSSSSNIWESKLLEGDSVKHIASLEAYQFT